MRSMFSRALAVVTVAGLAVAAAPASAVYTDGVRQVTLAQDANPNGISRPAVIVAGRDPATASSEPDTFQIYVEVPGFTLNPGTSVGQQIGVVDLQTSSSPIPNQPLTTNGPREGRPGSWLATVPGGIQIPIFLDFGQGLVNGAPGPKQNSTLVSLKVPSTAETFGLKLIGFSLKLNVDAKGCPTPAVGLTNPATEGTYTVSSLFIPRDAVGNPDPSQQSTRTADVAVKTGTASALPAECGGAQAAKIEVTPRKVAKAVKAGAKVTFTLKNTGAQANYQIKKAGKVLRNLPVPANKTIKVVIGSTKAEVGKTIKVDFSPRPGQTGNSVSVRYSVLKPKKAARAL